MGRASRARLESQFSLARHGEALRQVYAQALGGPAARP
jgi:hypothetical protein